jgi:hypothetical protein
MPVGHATSAASRDVTMESDRLYAVISALSEYVRSPSLRHIRDPRSLQKLAREIVQVVDRASSIWAKWEGTREDLAKAAVPCWIPLEDLRDFLNRLPGPTLTPTDVAQRLRALSEEPWGDYPNDDLKDGCLALYNKEKDKGTELPAIIGALREYIEREEERLRCEREETYRRNKEAERVLRLQRFQSGADCGWTKVTESEDLYCRRNGRTFRIARATDKRWRLYSITSLEDVGVLLGTYQGRGDANKALGQIAYQAEPNW